jgi:hypothetical protein
MPQPFHSPTLADRLVPFRPSLGGNIVSRRRYRYQEDVPLPWQVEVTLALVSLFAAPVGMVWIIWRIISPISRMSEALGMPIDLNAVLEPLQFGIWVFGLLVAFKAWLWLRRRVARMILDIPT